VSATKRAVPVEVPVILVSAGVLAGTTVLARRKALHPREHDAFRAVNGLPSTLLVPVFAVMQVGSLAAVFVAALLAWRFAGRRTAGAVFGTGFGAWLAAKGVKRFVQRGRPSAHMGAVHIRGPEERGLGFPSGHAGVSFGMATAAAGALAPPWSAVVWAIPPTVAFGRMYVGAHLPLDIIGGAALGVGLGAAVRLALRQSR
jgi:membrane-associated phospholipid phosphatase